MKLVKMRIIAVESNEDRQAIIEAILELYPVDAEVIRKNEYANGTEYIFHMHERDLGLLKHDIELLRICGYDIRKARS